MALSSVRAVVVALAGFACLVVGAACETSELRGDASATNEIGRLWLVHHWSGLPAAVQKAAQQVVRIDAYGFSGTGSFVQVQGSCRLLTNNHVLGAEVCAKQGCYVDLWFDQQQNSPGQKVQVRAVPVLVRPDLDVVLADVTAVGGSPRLATAMAACLALGDGGLEAVANGNKPAEIYVVGHPFAGLKKWSAGTVQASLGKWTLLSNWAAPGNSGSPILTATGSVVGVLHRGSFSALFQPYGRFKPASIATSSTAFAESAAGQAASALEPYSLLADHDAKTTIDHESLYSLGGATTAVVGGKTVAMVDLLADACNAALTKPLKQIEGPSSFNVLHRPCADAQHWLDCGQVPKGPGPAQVCPDSAKGTQWASRFSAYADRNDSYFGGANLSARVAAVASLAPADQQDQTGRTLLLAWLQANKPPLDFNIAYWLAVYAPSGAPLSYNNQDVTQFVLQATRQPGYHARFTTILSTIAWLVANGQITKATMQQQIDAWMADPHITLQAWIYAEIIRWGWFDKVMK